ncbi:MAG: MtnX-like HAD-IB family phosphatase [Thermoplasmatota archaeon]
MALGVMVDFDGTVTDVDASYRILERFANGDWLSVEQRAYAHEITILDALKVQAEMVRVSPEEAERYLLEEVKLREGFRDFAEWCRSHEVPLEICSDGFDFTIEMLLRNRGLDWIPYTSNRTVPSETGTTIEFPHHRPECPINANCKCSHLERMRERTGTVIFIGDGTTDECVSRKADILFARDKLLEICKTEGRECIPWEIWSEVLEEVQNIFQRQENIQI